MVVVVVVVVIVVKKQQVLLTVIITAVTSLMAILQVNTLLHYIHLMAFFPGQPG